MSLKLTFRPAEQLLEGENRRGTPRRLPKAHKNPLVAQHSTMR